MLVGISVTNKGITFIGIAPVGTKVFNTTGPTPDGKLPSPCDVPERYTANGLAQIVSLSSALTGTPTTK